jgi:hypothetical protein
MDVPVVHRTARMLLALQLLISTLVGALLCATSIQRCTEQKGRQAVAGSQAHHCCFGCPTDDPPHSHGCPNSPSPRSSSSHLCSTAGVLPSCHPWQAGSAAALCPRLPAVGQRHAHHAYPPPRCCGVSSHCGPGAGCTELCCSSRGGTHPTQRRVQVSGMGWVGGKGGLGSCYCCLQTPSAQQ